VELDCIAEVDYTEVDCLDIVELELKDILLYFGFIYAEFADF
jgi:hypothetical protein